MLSTIAAWWGALPPLGQGAVVTGVFTLVAAIGGALIVMYQLSRQAAIAREGHEHSGALKLKKAIYDDVRKQCDTASAAANDVEQFAGSFRNDVKRAQGQSSVGKLTNGIATIVSHPHHKIEDFAAKTSHLFNAVSDLVRTARSWTITEPRMAHYHGVFLDALSEGKLAVIDFHAASVTHYTDRSVVPSHWRPPDGMQMTQLEAATERLEDFIDRLIENISAFQSEMQTALLRDVFKGRITAPLSTP